MVIKMRHPHADWHMGHSPFFPFAWMGIADNFGMNFMQPQMLYSDPGTHYGKPRRERNSPWFTEIPIYDEYSDYSDDDDESDELSLSDEDIIRNICLSSLNLTQRDLAELERGEQLSDKHIYAAQKLLQNQFPDVEGFQDTCLSQTKFKPVSGETFALQIHHTRGNHWVLSSCFDSELCVYDSLYSSTSADLRKQLCDIYGTNLCDQQGQLRVILPKIQTQSGSRDCGLFAIALAYELCEGNDPSTIVFKQTGMRQHLHTCLEQGEITSFPKIRSRQKEGRYKEETIDCSINLD